MSKCYDIDHELKDAIEKAMEALLNVPMVGKKKYDQQHSDTHMRTYLQLKDAFKCSELADQW